jgi:tetratricopeptide (TPR) repeat protein
MAAACLFWRKLNGWITDRSQVMSEGARLAHRTIELGKDDAVALARGGHALANFVGDVDSGIALIDKALLLNPNLAAAWFLGGFVQIMRGEPDNAIERLAYAMRSSPLDPKYTECNVERRLRTVPRAASARPRLGPRSR